MKNIAFQQLSLFTVWMAQGKKLFLSLEVWDLIDMGHRVEDSGVKQVVSSNPVLGNEISLVFMLSLFSS